MCCCLLSSKTNDPNLDLRPDLNLTPPLLFSLLSSFFLFSLLQRTLFIQLRALSTHSGASYWLWVSYGLLPPLLCFGLLDLNTANPNSTLTCVRAGTQLRYLTFFIIYLRGLYYSIDCLWDIGYSFLCN